MSGFTGNNSGIRKIIAILLVIFGGGALGWCSKSNASEGLSIGLGKTTIGSEVCFTSLLITQELAEQRWLVTMSTHGEGYCREQEVRANVGFGVLRTTRLSKWMIGFGGGVDEHGDRGVGPSGNPDRPQLHAEILIRRYLWQERAVFDLLHKSTGGSTEYNSGKNFLVLAARF